MAFYMLKHKDNFYITGTFVVVKVCKSSSYNIYR